MSENIYDNNQYLLDLLSQQLSHNENIVRRAENTLNELLDGRTKTYLYIKNPDGEKICLKYGFKIEHYEIAEL